MKRALRLLTFLIVLPLVTAVPVYAHLTRAASGTLLCGGHHDFRLANTEIRLTHYVFRNFNAAVTITINRIVIKAFDGTILKDMPLVDPFPGAPFSNVLTPMETTRLDTEDAAVFGNSPSTLPAPGGPFQVIVEWSASAGGLELVGGVVGLHRAYVLGHPSGQPIRETRGRSTSACHSVR